MLASGSERVSNSYSTYRSQQTEAEKTAPPRRGVQLDERFVPGSPHAGGPHRLGGKYGGRPASVLCTARTHELLCKGRRLCQLARGGEFADPGLTATPAAVEGAFPSPCGPAGAGAFPLILGKSFIRSPA